MGRKVERARRRMSTTGPADGFSGEEGFTLLEIVCVMAIIAMLAAILLPAIPRGTSRARLEAYVTELTIPFVSAQASAGMYPFASILRAGGALAFGSDWSVSTPDPLHQLATAVARIDPDSDVTEALLPDERLDLEAAIAAQTIGAAHACGIDHETGSIEAGKRADLVVLDRDLHGLAPADHIEARVLATLVEGDVMYAAADSELSA